MDKPRLLVASFLALALATLASGQIPTCPGSGLAVTGGRFGDAFSLGITGPPGAAAILAADAADGQVMMSYGSICLGLTPALVTSPLVLDATGHFGTSGVLPLAPAFAAGETTFVQAALAHPSLSGGVALTNGAAVRFRPARMAVFRGHGLMPPGVGMTTLDLIDPVTGGVAATITGIPLVGGGMWHLKRQGWFAWRMALPTSMQQTTSLLDGSLYCVDDATGANVLTIPDVWSMAGGSWDVGEDGAYMFLTSTGMGQVYDRFWFKVYDLFSGNLLSLGAVPSVNFMTRGIYPIPGTSLAYVASFNKFHVVSAQSTTEIATILLPGQLSGAYANYGSYGNVYAFPTEGLLHCVAANMLITIDTTTHTIVNQAPLGPNGVVPLRIGPGSSGPALWGVTLTPGSSTYDLVEIPLSTGTPILAATASTPPTSATPSAGGTEMLFQFANGDVVAVNCVTHATVTLPAIGQLRVLGSDTLTKAYAFTLTGVSSFQTDPCSTSAVPITLSPGVTFPVANLLSN
jgi:hypothetical protein